MILHGSLCIDFLYMILHGVYIMGIMGYILVEHLILLFIYHHLCVYFIFLVMYILVLFLVVYQSRNMFYILYAYFFIDISSSFSFYQLCEIHPQLDENFWGCLHMCFTICSYMYALKTCLLNMNYPIQYHQLG